MIFVPTCHTHAHKESHKHPSWCFIKYGSSLTTTYRKHVKINQEIAIVNKLARVNRYHTRSHYNENCPLGYAGVWLLSERCHQPAKVGRLVTLDPNKVIQN